MIMNNICVLFLMPTSSVIIIAQINILNSFN